MKTIIVHIWLMFLLFAGHEFSIGQVNPFPLSLISTDIIYLRTEHYTSYQKKMKDIYLVTVTLQVKGSNSFYSDPFVIRIIDKSGKNINFILNRERKSLRSDEFYTFRFETPLDFKGFVRLLLDRFISKDRTFRHDNFSSSVTESTIYISKLK